MDLSCLGQGIVANTTDLVHDLEHAFSSSAVHR